MEYIGAVFYLPTILVLGLLKGLWWVVVNSWWALLATYLVMCYKHHYGAKRKGM